MQNKLLKRSIVTFSSLTSVVCISLFLFTILTYIGCNSNNSSNESKDGKIRIVCTIGMITDIVKNVGGDKVEVIGMMGAGIDPHYYKPTAKDIQTLSSAQIVFYNGLHLEARMGEVIAKMSGDTQTVAVTDIIDKAHLLRPDEFEGQYDPHIWFDVTLWMKAVEKVRDTLRENYPDDETVYQKNAEVYLAKLLELDQYVRTQTELIPTEQRVLVTAHDAFNYFGRAYGFKVRGLQGISTATEASIADVQNLANFIVEKRIPTIFVETSVSTRKIGAVKAAVNAKGFEVELGEPLYSDAMGDEETPEGTYIGMIRSNIDTIVKGLTREMSVSEED